MNIRQPSACQHFNLPSCPFMDDFVNNYGPTSGIFEPTRGILVLAHHNHLNPNPNPFPECGLVEIPIAQSSLTSPNTKPTPHILQPQRIQTITADDTYILEPSLPSLKRKSPSPLPGDIPKKVKSVGSNSENSHPYLEKHDFEKLPYHRNLSSGSSLSPLVVSYEIPSSFSINFQPFPMAEEAGLIMPPTSP